MKKPLMQFVKDSYLDWRRINYEDIFNLLRENGYYELNVEVDLEKFNTLERYWGYENWCEEHCPNDFIALLGTFMFTDKYTAMMMKLSVE